MRLKHTNSWCPLTGDYDDIINYWIQMVLWKVVKTHLKLSSRPIMNILEKYEFIVYFIVFIWLIFIFLRVPSDSTGFNNYNNNNTNTRKTRKRKNALECILLCFYCVLMRFFGRVCHYSACLQSVESLLCHAWVMPTRTKNFV